MKMMKISVAFAAVALLASCGSKSQNEETTAPVVDEETYVVDTIATAPAMDADGEMGAASTSGTDWDAILDEYEEYMKKTMSIAKKVQSGDMNAAAEYASLMEKAESLSSKLEKANDELTPAQVKRLNKIATKYASDAASLL